MQILGGPVFKAHVELLQAISAIFGLDVSNLEILKIGDFPGMSSNSTMPFHNLASTLVHRLSQHQQNRPSWSKCVHYRNPSQSAYVAFSKGAMLTF